MRFTQPELDLIKSTFKDNEKLLKLLRKVFLPEYDPQAPFGQTVDLWMTIDLSNLSPEEQIIRLIARNTIITHIEAQLMQLNTLAELKELTPQERAEKAMQDSMK